MPPAKKPADTLVLIPARLASTRLPGKPLADIAGLPMIVQVIRRAEEAKLGPVWVATDDLGIKTAVEKAGGNAVMTRADHISGSDRIFEALRKIDPKKKVKFVVNVQGDLPTIEPATIRAALAPLKDKTVDIATVTAVIDNGSDKQNPNIVKVIGSDIGKNRMRALYFTRAMAPAGKGPLYHHIGLYAYRRTALEKFVKLKPSNLEKREKLEQLRALEAGMRINVVVVDAVPLGVDTPAELEKGARDPARKALISMNDSKSKKKIVYQGEPGANSDTAAREAYPAYTPVPCATFEDAFAAVSNRDADLAMIPVENSVAGRVADIHHLMPTSGLNIVAEYFLPINHQLLGVKGAKLSDLKSVQSHIMALGQCRKVIKQLGLKAVIGADTAGSARQIAEAGDKSHAAIASKLAGEIYGLDLLQENIEDEAHNTTRFILLSREPDWAPQGKGLTVTTFVFRVRNVPAALYKAMGGFATNGVNMTKLESYQLGGSFSATQFYADVEGHPEDRSVKLALEELAFYSREMKILGVYPAHEYRMKAAEKAE